MLTEEKHKETYCGQVESLAITQNHTHTHVVSKFGMIKILTNSQSSNLQSETMND